MELIYLFQSYIDSPSERAGSRTATIKSKAKPLDPMVDAVDALKRRSDCFKTHPDNAYLRMNSN